MTETHSRFDIRHKETLTLFLREYFELFFPDLAKKLRFETAVFLDKELTALFGESEEQHKITDALILIRMAADDEAEKRILIHWEQESKKKKDFEERMFHYFCGIYFRYRCTVFPIAMFTDPVKWKKPVKNTFRISLFRYPVNRFSYRLIKLKNYKAGDLEKKTEENPLAAAYLPLTDYPDSERPVIKAKAVLGIAKLPPGQKQATLFSLIQESLQLDRKEEKQFQKLIRTDPLYKEVKMLQSVKDVGIEEGFEKGIQKGIEKGIQKGIEKGIQKGIEKGRFMALEETAKNLLRSSLLTKKQIAEFTGLSMKKINELAKSLD
jgi:hypothetical protein